MNTATARKLAPKVERPQKKKSRTPLAIVKHVPTQRIPRIPLPILCSGLFVAALMALLVLNIGISSAQYELASLKAASNAITAQNQALSEQVRSYQAPQNLALRAAELGMVANQSSATINVDTLAVIGTPKAAVEGDPTGSLIPAPEINSHYLMAPPVVDPIVTADSVVDESVSAPAAEETVAEDSPADEVVEHSGEMFGGTVPAPAQRIPGE